MGVLREFKVDDEVWHIAAGWGIVTNTGGLFGRKTILVDFYGEEFWVSPDSLVLEENFTVEDDF